MFTRLSDPADNKVSWMSCHWLRDVRGDLSLWKQLQALTSLRCILPLALRWWGYYSPARVYHSLEGPGPGRYRKILAVLKHIESEASRGSVTSFLSAAERFAMHSEGSWLKVAGGQKAEVLEGLLDRSVKFNENARGSNNSELRGYLAVECGAFIGYTASRLAGRLRNGRDDHVHSSVFVSIEGDPIHALIARHFLDFVHLARDAEICPGMVRDVIPSLTESFGWSAAGFVFMDQKGTAFHGDFALFQSLQSWHPGAIAAADNVLRPGAPVFVWQLMACNVLESTFWSLPEFLEESMGVEDWMAVVELPTSNEYCD